MTDEELIKLLRLGEWGGAGDEEMVLTAGRIEELLSKLDASQKRQDRLMVLASNAQDREVALQLEIKALKEK